MDDDALARLAVTVLFLLVIWVLPVPLGIISARRKGISPHWMWFGIYPFGGWIAFIVIACSRGSAPCPSCGHRVPSGVRICSACGADLWASPAPAQVAPPAGVPPAYPGPPAYLPRPSAPPRPTVVTVIGILGIIVGSLSLLSLPFTLLQVTGVFSRLPGNAATRFIYEDPTFRTWMAISLPLGFIAAVLWIFTGIGLLKMQAWAYRVCLWLLCYAIIMGVAGMSVTTALFLHPSARWPSFPGGDLMRVSGIVGGLIGGLFGVALYSVVLVLMLGRAVRAAFAPSSP